MRVLNFLFIVLSLYTVGFTKDMTIDLRSQSADWLVLTEGSSFHPENDLQAPSGIDVDFNYGLDVFLAIEGYESSIDADYHSPLKLSLSAFAKILNGLCLNDAGAQGSLITTLNKGLRLQYMIASATQTNGFNSDIGGFDDANVYPTATYEELATFSGPLSFVNQIPVLALGTDSLSIKILFQALILKVIV